MVPIEEKSPKQTSEIACNEPIFESKMIDLEPKLQCPFSGLPAAHLLIKKSPKIGNLQRIKDKTSIFNQSKRKYYAGLLDGWLLMYSSNCDLKPTTCLNLQSYDLCNSDLHRKREQFQLISNEYKTDYSRSPKKYLLQAASASDYEEWLVAITTATKSSLTRMRLNSFGRKLPSPPPGSIPQTRLSDRSEDIYEEPSEMVGIQLYPSFQFDSWTQFPVAPALPVKCGLKSKSQFHIESVAYDIPKSPPEPTVLHQEYQNKIQQVKSQLTMQLSVPKQMAKSSVDGDEDKSKSKKKSKVLESSEVPKLSKRNWFLNRLSGRNIANSGKLPMGTINTIGSNLTVVTEFTEGERLDGKRGGKVNMIINQLEANGHLPQRKKKLSESRQSRCSVAAGEDEDCHNYEPVVVSGRMK